MSRTSYEVTACVLLRRADRWLLTVRAPGVDDAPGTLGLVGGHVDEQVEGGEDGSTAVLEDTARREASEEVGLDLRDVALRYLESELFSTDSGAPQICVTYVAGAPQQEPRVADPDELTEVGWWSADDAARDPRCPAWLPALLRRADAASSSNAVES